MALDLGAEAEREAPARLPVQIPRDVGHNHGTAREADGDGRTEADPFRRHGGKGQRRKRIVADLEADDTVKAGIFSPTGDRANAAPVVHGNAGFYLHG